jgi:hypothetical protein
MSFIRRSLALLALMAAAGPLHAQSSRFDASTFSMELPSGLGASLRLVQKKEDPSSGFESHAGSGMHLGKQRLVLVNRTFMRGIPSDPVLADSAAMRRMLADPGTARWRQLMETPMDTSAAARGAYVEAMSDTSLAVRRAALHQMHSLFSREGFIRLDGAGREIITEERVTRRAPVVLDMDNGPLHGLADLTVSRHGGLWETWMVIYVSADRTAASEAAAVRMLNSFRPKSAAAAARRE